jgi:hypothetical protein
VNGRGLPPEPTELVYLAKSSWLPIFAALGVALVLVGLFTWWPYAAIGAVIGLVASLAWIRDATRETSRLPIEQRESSAVLPAIPLRRPTDAE